MTKFDQMRGGQPKRSDAFQPQSEFAGVFRELFNLLEEYAPLWYTEEHHNRAVAALRALQESRQLANPEAARPPTRLQRAQYLNHSIQLVRPAPRYASHRIGISTLRVQSWPATVIHTIRILPALNFRFAIHPIFSSKLAISYVRRTVIQRTRRDGRTASPTRGITNLEVFTTPANFQIQRGTRAAVTILFMAWQARLYSVQKSDRACQNFRNPQQ